MKRLKFSADLDIRNVENLPRGRMCPFLLCITGKNDALIAKQWKRKAPATLGRNEVLVSF